MWQLWPSFFKDITHFGRELKASSGCMWLHSPLELFYIDLRSVCCQFLRNKSLYKEKIQNHTPLWESLGTLVWHDADRYKTFRGVIVNMDVNLKPKCKDHFPKYCLNRHSFFKDLFIRNQFIQIVCPCESSEPCCYLNKERENSQYGEMSKVGVGKELAHKILLLPLELVWKLQL